MKRRAAKYRLFTGVTFHIFADGSCLRESAIRGGLYGMPARKTVADALRKARRSLGRDGVRRIE